MLPWKQTKEEVRVAVIGDLILDEYVDGEVSRISPEAPVPIVLANSTHYRPGGAANVALNIQRAGGQSIIFGVCGQDQAGSVLTDLIYKEGVNTKGILKDKNRQTTRKCRIRSKQQQIVRIDWESTQTLCNHQQGILFDQLCQSDFDTLLISDYGKGSLSASFIQQLLNYCKAKGIPSVVDPKGIDFAKYRGCDLITPNKSEAYQAIKFFDNVPSENDPAKIGLLLQKKLGLNNILITLGAEGMILIPKERAIKPTLQPSKARDVFDVSGAGDTVASITSLGLASKVPLIEAISIANTAAGFVVEKQGTYAIYDNELEKALSKNLLPILEQEKILKLDSLERKVASLRKKNKKIVFTNGCFDLLHSGHTSYLRSAKALGDFLVVAVNTDASIKKLKGPARPIMELSHRQELIASLQCVDWVISFDEETPEKLIQQLQPDILVKGSDYKEDEIVGADFVKKRGGLVRTLPLVPSLSTSTIIQKIKAEPC